MSQSVSWFIALKYVLVKRRNRSVSFISAIAMSGIVLGVALLITVLSVMNGFDRELKERILGIMPQLTLYHRQGIRDWSTLREQLLTHESIQGVTPFVELQAMLHHKQHTRPVLVYGVHAGIEHTVSEIDGYLKQDTLKQLSRSPQFIAIGKGLANALSLEVGDQVTMIVPGPLTSHQMNSKAPVVRRLRIIDVFNTQTELDHSLTLVGLAAATRLYAASGEVSGLRLKVDQLLLAPAVAHGLESSLPYGFYTTNWTDTHGNIYYAIKMSKNLVGLLLFLIIAIAAFNVVSTLVMVVVDKQGDIAILRTLGLSTHRVMRIFIIQGALIGVMGTAFGVLLGVLLALLVPAMVAVIEQYWGMHFLQTDIYPVDFLPSMLMWQDVAAVAGVSLLMSLLATLYPAWKAARVMPAEALRYD